MTDMRQLSDRCVASLVLALVLSALCGTAVFGQTVVGGMITSDQVWDEAGSPYQANLTVMVANGATLTIEPNVTVEFATNRALHIIDGTLLARGAEGSNILFTCQDPDRYWANVYFGSGAVSASYDQDSEYLSGSILEHVTIERCDYSSGIGRAVVVGEGSAPCISSCLIRTNKMAAIYFDSVDEFRVDGTEIDFSYRFPSSDWSIYALNCTNVTILDNSVHDSYRGIGLRRSQPGSSAAVVRGNRIFACTEGLGLWAQNIDELEISGNTICSNTSENVHVGFGLTVKDCPNAVVTNNEISFNMGVLGSGGWSRAHDWPTGAGGALFGSCSNLLFRGNSVCYNSNNNTNSFTAGGLCLTNCTDATIEGNIILGNTYYSGAALPSVYAAGGALFLHCMNTVFANNEVVSNSVWACHIGGLGNPTGGLRFHGEEVFSVTPYFHTSQNALIVSNSIVGNAGYVGGMYVEYGSKLTHNTICSNSSDSAQNGVGGVYGWCDVFSENRLCHNESRISGCSLSHSSIWPPFDNGGVFENNRVVNNTKRGAPASGNAACYVSSFDLISGNVISENNSSGFLLHDSTVQMFDNVIQSNTGHGLIVHSNQDDHSISTMPGRPTIISGNGGYQVQNLSAFQSSFEPTGPANIDARNVDWGTTSEAAIQGGISDYFTDASKGIVFWRPYNVPAPGPITAPEVLSSGSSGGLPSITFNNTFEDGIFMIETTTDLVDGEWVCVTNIIPTGPGATVTWTAAESNEGRALFSRAVTSPYLSHD